VKALAWACNRSAPGAASRGLRAKALADFAVLDASLHGEQRLGRVITQRSGKRDLFFGGKARGLNVGCTEFLQQLARKALDDWHACQLP